MCFYQPLRMKTIVCSVVVLAIYLQLVWAETREVGCAIKKCPSLTAFGQRVKDAWYIGCWYDPK